MEAFNCSFCNKKVTGNKKVFHFHQVGNYTHKECFDSMTIAITVNKSETLEYKQYLQNSIFKVIDGNTLIEEQEYNNHVSSENTAQEDLLIDTFYRNEIEAPNNDSISGNIHQENFLSNNKRKEITADSDICSDEVSKKLRSETIEKDLI
eukprot:TRINITY_DN3581_c0_g1_i1.p2 TRINITY_DN3581_c0_g1~~TRINITY_DN3581_c0_g1_i1.p2  ORF type:complete len:150 (-),score=45.27 TRINITY_DN3581_c0_g1_i1:173-622(-)